MVRGLPRCHRRAGRRGRRHEQPSPPGTLAAAAAPLTTRAAGGRSRRGRPATAELLAASEAERAAGGPRHRIPPSGTEVPRASASPRAGESCGPAENPPGAFPSPAALPHRATRTHLMFAGEGGPATNARFTSPRASLRPACRRPRLGDALRADPTSALDIWGKVGNSGVVGGDPRRHEGTSSPGSTSRPVHVGVHDHQRAGAGDPRHVPQHRHRPAPRARPAEVLRTVRGTVQADILGEDQGQNTCILSTEFALRMMADIQAWFIEHEVRRFYSVSISGYHIAEAGARPHHPARLHPLQRLHPTWRRTWPRAWRSTTSPQPQLLLERDGPRVHRARPGRPAHLGGRHAGPLRRRRAQPEAEVPRADLRPVAARPGDGVQRHPHHLQAPGAIYDNANSLHTNAYDEAVTTPTDESVRRPSPSSSSSTGSGAWP